MIDSATLEGRLEDTYRLARLKIEKLVNYADLCRDMLATVKELEGENERLIAARVVDIKAMERLREAIDSAPCPGQKGIYCQEHWECDCWKRKALEP